MVEYKGILYPSVVDLPEGAEQEIRMEVIEKTLTAYAKHFIWVDALKKHPDIGQEVLVFCQGYDVTGTRYWSHFELAVFDRNYYDKRTYAYYKSLDYRVNNRPSDDSLMGSTWRYRDVTHWMPLPEPPPPLSKGAYEKLTGQKYERPRSSK